MPGANCCIPECGTCRRHEGIGLFKIPKKKSEDSYNFKEHEKWRVALINEVTKVREVDKDFQNQLDKGNVSICERHFKSDNIDHCKYICKTT